MNRELFLTYVFVIICVMQNYAQNLERVTHTFGSQIVNGIEVEVLKSGSTSSYTSCNVGPYWAGGATSDGSYSFIFNPSISELRLDFNLINGIYTSGIEEVQIFVNGIHYPVFSQGDSLLGCSFVAEISPDGNITGSVPTRQYGWSDTRIYGDIDSIRVYNKVISGAPYGSIFSLYINDGAMNLEEIQDLCNNIDLLVNHKKKEVYIKSYDPIVEAQVINMNGAVLLYSNSNTINLYDISQGLYLVKIKTINCELIRKIILN